MLPLRSLQQRKAVSITYPLVIKTANHMVTLPEVIRQAAWYVQKEYSTIFKWLKLLNQGVGTAFDVIHGHFTPLSRLLTPWRDMSVERLTSAFFFPFRCFSYEDDGLAARSPGPCVSRLLALWALRGDVDDVGRDDRKSLGVDSGVPSSQFR